MPPRKKAKVEQQRVRKVGAKFYDSMTSNATTKDFKEFGITTTEAVYLAVDSSRTPICILI